MAELCEHFSAVNAVDPRTKGCEDCLAIGAKWTELRICMTCGHVGCCEDSQHAHALQHFKATGHPIIVPLERSETWSWCYVHRRYFDYTPPRKRSALSSLLGRLIGR